MKIILITGFLPKNRERKKHVWQQQGSKEPPPCVTFPVKSRKGRLWKQDNWIGESLQGPSSDGSLGARPFTSPSSTEFPGDSNVYPSSIGENDSTGAFSLPANSKLPSREARNGPDLLGGPWGEKELWISPLFASRQRNPRTRQTRRRLIRSQPPSGERRTDTHDHMTQFSWQSHWTSYGCRQGLRGRPKLR